MSAPVLMALVALLCGVGAYLFFARATRSEASVYRNRIAATMLAAAAIILIAYAYALHSWRTP